MSEQQARRSAQRTAERAVQHLGDAVDALMAADRLTMNHEYLDAANAVGTLISRVRDINERQS